MPIEGRVTSAVTHTSLLSGEMATPLGAGTHLNAFTRLTSWPAGPTLTTVGLAIAEAGRVRGRRHGARGGRRAHVRGAAARLRVRHRAHDRRHAPDRRGRHGQQHESEGGDPPPARTAAARSPGGAAGGRSGPLAAPSRHAGSRPVRVAACAAVLGHRCLLRPGTPDEVAIAASIAVGRSMRRTPARTSRGAGAGIMTSSDHHGSGTNDGAHEVRHTQARAAQRRGPLRAVGPGPDVGRAGVARTPA